MSKTLLPQLPTTTRRWGSSVPRPVTSATTKTLAERLASRQDEGRSRASPAVRPTTAFLPEETRVTTQQLASRPRTGLARPKSGTVRPLSGRVFIRRTVKNGWVAKGVDGSHVNLDDLDQDWEDTDSVDSFFDDDFEEHETKETLENLLSCNTLGVESKGRPPDWISGELAIPKFHCPRCRDHWYGLSAFPCDEELARLIREGLWYTGKGDSKNKGAGSKDNDHDGTSSRAKRGLGYCSSSDCQNLSGKTTGFATSKLDHNIDFLDPNHAKKNRKITFRLEGDDSANDMQSGSSCRLLGDEKGKSGSLGNDATCCDGLDSLDFGALRNRQKNGNTSSSASDLNSGSSGNLLVSKGDGKPKGSGRRRLKSGKGRRKRAGKMDEGADSSKGNSGEGGASNVWGEASGTGEETDLFGSNGTDQPGRDQDGQGESGGIEGHGRHRSNSLSSSKAGNSQTSLYSGSRGSRLGSGKGSVGKGYMRVPSSANQEWGNPTHALPWASNTANSSQASLAQGGGGRHDNGNHGNWDKWAVSLPPIPPSKEKLFDFLELPPGFELTRAFTYSYY